MDCYDANEVEKMYAYMRGEIHALKECLSDLCGLAETVSDDPDLIAIGRHPETKQWRVWHEEYPDEGSPLPPPAHQRQKGESMSHVYLGVGGKKILCDGGASSRALAERLVGAAKEVCEREQIVRENPYGRSEDFHALWRTVERLRSALADYEAAKEEQ